MFFNELIKYDILGIREFFYNDSPLEKEIELRNSFVDEFSESDGDDGEIEISCSNDPFIKRNLLPLRKNLGPIIQKVRDLMKFYRYGKRRDELSKLQLSDADNNFKVPLQCELDCPTRWNTLYSMIVKFLRLSHVIQIHHVKIERNYPLSPQEYAIIQVFELMYFFNIK